MKQHKWHKEPVAYMAIDEINGDYMLEKEKDNGIEWTPLYTRPTKPLTDKEIIKLIDIDCPPDKAICGNTKGIIKLARAIEQAHGIGEDK